MNEHHGPGPTKSIYSCYPVEDVTFPGAWINKGPPRTAMRQGCSPPELFQSARKFFSIVKSSWVSGVNIALLSSQVGWNAGKKFVQFFFLQWFWKGIWTLLLNDTRFIFTARMVWSEKKILSRCAKQIFCGAYWDTIPVRNATAIFLSYIYNNLFLGMSVIHSCDTLL